MRRTPGLPVLSLAVAALVLAGCTAGGSDAPSDDATGPLSAWFEKVGGSYEGEDYERQQRESEEIVAACMAEEGFEYTPAEPMAGGEAEDAPEMDTKEFAEQYGYGVTFSDELYGSGEDWVDPNEDYVAAMSESEQAAYYEALMGAMADYDYAADPEGTNMPGWEEQGCNGKAQHEVYDQDIWSNPSLESFWDEMQREYEGLADANPELAEAEKKWSACMAEAGFDFAGPDEAQQSVYDQWDALYQALPAYDPDADPDELDPAAYEIDPAAEAELREQELSLAPADYECRASTGYDEAYDVANLELEKRLWDKYGAELEAATGGSTPSE
ncbi:hypothetical protein J1G42_07470 [Cellulomonas sp. zg-ZUI222]|uniref:hypothetical protein n=1 Tax=Cellulomonas wangleii TaxID=2816956 RepID=UPI001A943FDE|nr:hypothetical protein [Cellulomonas wangleii]MBO0920663.1 hypothetical protein [Cellulomonas wangleii]